jgi:hypothetical protein
VGLCGGARLITTTAATAQARSSRHPVALACCFRRASAFVGLDRVGTWERDKAAVVFTGAVRGLSVELAYGSAGSGEMLRR